MGGCTVSMAVAEVELSTAGTNWMSTGAGCCCCRSRCSQLNASFTGGLVSTNLKELRVGDGEASEKVKELGFRLLLSLGLGRGSSEKEFLESDGLLLLLSTLLPLILLADFVLKQLRPVRMFEAEKLEEGKELLLLLLLLGSKIDLGDLISSFLIFGQDSFVSIGSFNWSQAFFNNVDSGRLRLELKMFRFFKSAKSFSSFVFPLQLEVEKVAFGEHGDKGEVLEAVVVVVVTQAGVMWDV